MRAFHSSVDNVQSANPSYPFAVKAWTRAKTLTLRGRHTTNVMVEGRGANKQTCVHRRRGLESRNIAAEECDRPARKSGLSRVLEVGATCTRT